MDTLTNIFANPDQLWQYIKQYAVKAGREATRMVLEYIMWLKPQQLQLWIKQSLLEH